MSGSGRLVWTRSPRWWKPSRPTMRAGAKQRSRLPMTINNALAGAAVRNLDEATAWYGRLLRQAPDRQPMPNDVEYRFAGGGWLHGFVDPQRAGKSSVTTLGALE